MRDPVPLPVLPDDSSVAVACGRARTSLSSESIHSLTHCATTAVLRTMRLDELFPGHQPVPGVERDGIKPPLTWRLARSGRSDIWVEREPTEQDPRAGSGNSQLACQVTHKPSKASRVRVTAGLPQSCRQEFPPPILSPPSSQKNNKAAKT